MVLFVTQHNNEPNSDHADQGTLSESGHSQRAFAAHKAPLNSQGRPEPRLELKATVVGSFFLVDLALDRIADDRLHR